MSRCFWMAAGLAVLSVGCRIAAAPEQVTAGPDPAPAAGAQPIDLPEPAILSAHLGIVDALAFERLDALPVVFSGDLDAASLQPNAFSVMFSDGSRVTPAEARLAPASENDENRTVLLIGDFGDPVSRPPTDVMVIGRLFGEGGESYEGLVISVEPFEAGGKVVFAQRVAATPGTCEGQAQAVRTYWIDGIRGVDEADLAGIAVTLEDGSRVAPVGFDDHDLENEDRDDNVLDLCVAEASPAARIELEAGLFADPPGHPTVAVQIDVAASRR